MTTAPDQTRDATPIKGSWEERLQTAQQLAANRNDDAIALYEMLITRLRKMPKVQRQAANRRLQNILMQASVDLHSYLTMREQYDQALDVLAGIIAEMPYEDAQRWESHGAAILLQAGRTDEAVAKLRALAEKPEADLDQWAELTIMQMRVQRMDDAEATFAEMESWIEERYADEEPTARQRDEALIAALRTTLWIERGDPQQAIDWLNKAIRLDEEQKSRIPLVYIRLLRHGFYDEALPLIQRDVQAPVRSDFWLGYTHFHRGDEARAKREWTRAIERDISKPENQHIMELILSRYYLGDPAGEGLSTVLQILSEKGSQYWAFFFLAGLGWGMRDNIDQCSFQFRDGHATAAFIRRRTAAPAGGMAILP